MSSMSSAAVDANIKRSIIKKIGDRVHPFGKHKGKTYLDLLTNDRDYLMWLLDQDYDRKKYLGKNLNDLERLFDKPITKIVYTKKPEGFEERILREMLESLNTVEEHKEEGF